MVIKPVKYFVVAKDHTVMVLQHKIHRDNLKNWIDVDVATAQTQGAVKAWNSEIMTILAVRLGLTENDLTSQNKFKPGVYPCPDGITYNEKVGCLKECEGMCGECNHMELMAVVKP